MTAAIRAHGEVRPPPLSPRVAAALALFRPYQLGCIDVGRMPSWVLGLLTIADIEFNRLKTQALKADDKTPSPTSGIYRMDLDADIWTT